MLVQYVKISSHTISITPDYRNVSKLTHDFFLGIYVSSKSAAKKMSECMRTELAPLGVRVITAVVGAVHTPIHERAGELNMPPNSYYQSLRDHINEVRKGTTKPGAVDTETVCKGLIADITGGKSGVVWRGGTATAVRLLSWLAPASVWDSIVNNGRGLDLISRPSTTKNN